MNLPKNIYFYWGNKTMSFLRFMSLYSFKKFNPDWKVTLIKRKNQKIPKDHGWEERSDSLYFKGEDCSDLIHNLDIDIKYLEGEYPEIAKLDLEENHISDLLLFKILGEEGGIVSDTDILYYKQIDYKKIKDIDVGIISFKDYPGKAYIPLSFMLGKPNKFFKQMYDKLKKKMNVEIWDNSPSLMDSFKQIKNKFKDLNIIRLPSHLVFPFSEEEEPNACLRLMFEKEAQIPKDSIGTHWYGANPNSQRFNNKLTKDNYKNSDNTICKIIQEIYK